MTEWHVTVKGDPLDWHRFCLSVGVKPLYIELSNFSTQLMYASRFPSVGDEIPSRFEVLRKKKEVSESTQGEAALYFEAHAKFDGVFRPIVGDAVITLYGMSRDLYRANRWYLTARSKDKQALDEFETFLQRYDPRDSVLVGLEREVCVLDTCPELDAGWL